MKRTTFSVDTLKTYIGLECEVVLLDMSDTPHTYHGIVSYRALSGTIFSIEENSTGRSVLFIPEDVVSIVILKS
jgi:hypothetical protein